MEILFALMYLEGRKTWEINMIAKNIWNKGSAFKTPFYHPNPKETFKMHILTVLTGKLNLLYFLNEAC